MSDGSLVTRRGRAGVAAGVVLILVLITGLALGARHHPSGPRVALPLKQTAAVDLPGGATRFDYADLDPATRHLWIAHMGDDSVVEVNLADRNVIRTVTGLASATGVTVVPALRRVFVSVPGSGEVAVLDADSGAVLTRISAGKFPDGSAWVPDTGQVWVSDERGGVETVIDGASGRLVGTVDLGGEAGNVRWDPTSGKVLVDVQSRDQLVVIDPRSRVVERRVQLPGCANDHGLLIGAGRAFVACDGNARLVVLSLPGLTPVGSQTLGADPDVLWLDAGRGLLYVAAESGVLTMLDLSTPEGRVIGRDHAADNAHIVAVDPTDGSVLLPVPRGTDGRPQLLVLGRT